MLAGKASEKTITENDRAEMFQKSIRKNSCSNRPYRNASWNSVRENYH